MSIDAQIAALWTLICILTGALITLVLVAVMGDRGDPGPEDEPEPIDPDLESWLIDNTTIEFFEADLLRGGVATDRTAR